MSARNTFVTSYIYDDKAMDAIEGVLHSYTDYILREPHFFAGVFKTLRFVVPDVKLNTILLECDDALARAGYKLQFDIAIVGDDEDVVIHRADTSGWYRARRKEILTVPEQYLGETISVIRYGVDHIIEWALDISPVVIEQLEKWCNEGEKYLLQHVGPNSNQS